MRITNGTFSYDGPARNGDSSIRMTVTGTFARGKITGQIAYPDAPETCTARSYSAKYYGVNPQG